MITFPDISFYQDNDGTPQGIDFVQMATQTKAVIIRAGQSFWLDQDFIANWQGAKAAGLMRGSYWFYDSRTSPKRQAELWRALIGNDKPECGLLLDFEESYGGSYGSDRHMKEFADLVVGKFPNVKVGVYTGYYWWLTRVTWRTRSYWKRFPLWIAAYPRNPTDGTYKPRVPAPFSNWLYWQYTDSGDGKAYGVESSRIDLNKFNGTWQDFSSTGHFGA
mgnify:CR=1 FL=1